MSQRDQQVILLERLNGCARCWGDGHDNIAFEKLEHPFEPEGVKEAYTHWAPCPTNGEPILMAIVPDEEDDEPIDIPAIESRRRDDDNDS